MTSKPRTSWSFLVGLAAGALPLGVALAQAPAVVMMQPIPDPLAGPVGSRPSSVRVLSPADHDLFLRAFAYAAQDDWRDALALAAQGRDSTARQLLQWRYALDRNSGAQFADIDAVLKAATGWPLRNTLLARAEAAMVPASANAGGMSADQIVAWFGGREPVSGIGRIRLGEALVATGQRGRGALLIRQGWIDGSFDAPTEAAILAADAAYLTPESDRARLDALIWRGEFTAARRQMARVDADSAALAQARIALAGGVRQARAALAKVSDSRDPALLYAWSRALRLDNQDDEAHRMLLRADPTALARDHTQQWWAEVHVQARDAMQAGNPRTALALIDHAALPAGAQYADQQFLGGFIALRLLKDPMLARGYFQRLADNVSRPISKARGEYWLGRAYEAAGDNASALSHYRKAGAYPETFYGQLALARCDDAPMLHLNDADVTAAPRSQIENDALMPQMRVLAELGQAGDLRQFAEADARAYPEPRHLKAFLASLTEWGYPEIAVRLAKQASYDGLTLLAYTHPVIPIPPFPAAAGTAPDPALVLGLIRQETEFNPYAVSAAGARGLMQMMPASARVAARQGGLPYRPEALTGDQAYNMQLGMIEYAGHLASWGGSLVLAAAAYNAGDGNARKWIAANGDPRNGSVDPIDWIEEIPFGETRNYVQRVLENLEVYRSRLAGRDVPLRIMADLYAPASPPAVALGSRANN